MAREPRAWLSPALLAEAPRFLRFCLVGGVGFLTDAGVLLAATRVAGLGPIAGRAVSFTVAVVVTWLLNRSWSFKSADQARRGLIAEFTSYLGVQSVGFACNAAVYAALVLAGPAPLGDPLVALAIASVAALLVNYLGLRAVVFKGHGT